MQIVLNGAPRPLDATLTVAQLVLEVAPSARRIAVELNGEIVPRSRHVERRLRDGDRIEIVQAVGGG